MKPKNEKQKPKLDSYLNESMPLMASIIEI
jgi:hypothetical protein